jgi:hypothetical protein
MPERDIQYSVRRALSAFNRVRMFRFQSGRFWQGEEIERGINYVVLRHPRRVNVGFEGLADLDGWITRTVSADMVGQSIAQFAAIEVKTMGQKPTAVQAAFLSTVRNMGGLAGVATSVDDAKRILLLS